ncbi:MAG: 3-deoxy-8-phosphooctulonate synthase [Candidatus Omnitrophica bacterium]|nr:3-deoxy-8-phosphooctulonate synthase [Candidatus Omnitrophota bacterium]
MMKEIKVGDVKLSNKGPLVLIAGPCVIESEEFCLSCAQELKKIARQMRMPLIFKSSYDKANRSSIDSYRGPGITKGLEILKKVKKKFGLPVISDVHCRSEITQAAGVLDIIQIPAFLSRQTDLILAAARTKKPINIKKGQFLAPWDVENVIKKVLSTGNKKVLITERGSSFGYNNLVSDMRSLAIIGALGYPVVFDATHSVQLPGAAGIASGGDRRFVATLSRAAVAVGCAGLFLEVHPKPKRALSDGPNMIGFAQLQELLRQVKEIDVVVKKHKAC